MHPVAAAGYHQLQASLDSKEIVKEVHQDKMNMEVHLLDLQVAPQAAVAAVALLMILLSHLIIQAAQVDG
jgi:hypothetical protein